MHFDFPHDEDFSAWLDTLDDDELDRVLWCIEQEAARLRLDAARGYLFVSQTLQVDTRVYTEIALN